MACRQIDDGDNNDDDDEDEVNAEVEDLASVLSSISNSDLIYLQIKTVAPRIYQANLHDIDNEESGDQNCQDDSDDNAANENDDDEYGDVEYLVSLSPNRASFLTRRLPADIT